MVGLWSFTPTATDWLGADFDAFGGLNPTSEVVLDLEDYRVSVKMSELDSARKGLTEALERGFSVKSLGLSFENDLQLRLTDDFHLRGIWTPSNEIEEDPEFDTFVSKASLEVSSLVEAVEFLCEMFGYQEEAK